MRVFDRKKRIGSDVQAFTLEEIAGGITPETASQAVGQNFYIQPAEISFVQRVGSWLEYLKIPDLFPSAVSLAGRVHEVGEQLRSAGDASFLGLSDTALNLALIRPGDYVALLHEATHINPAYNGSLLSSEAGAFATQIFAAGDFDGHLGILHDSKSYNATDKRIGRFIAEASLVLGRRVFDALRATPEKTNQVGLAVKLGEEVHKYESEMKQRGKSARDYLVETHGLTPFIADYLLAITGDTAETIVRSTSQSKKDVIGAFKALASFYHVNLGYSIDDAVSKTEEHFRNDDALTIHKTLMFGSRDVFAKLQEYGFSLETGRGLAELMISRGGARAIRYAEGIPPLLEFTAQYGPNGEKAFASILRVPNLFDALTLTEGSAEFLKLSRVQPEQARLVLSELQQFDWSSADALGKFCASVAYVDQYGSSSYSSQLMKLPPADRARAVATAVYLACAGVNSWNPGGRDHIGNVMDIVVGRVGTGNYASLIGQVKADLAAERQNATLPAAQKT